MVHTFNLAGALVTSFDGEGWQYPYLVGSDSTSALVYLPSVRRIDKIVGDRVEVATTYDQENVGLTYAAANSDFFVLKVLPKSEAGTLTIRRRVRQSEKNLRLDAPQWTFAGGLLIDSDTVYSLRGFQPTIDLFTEDGPAEQRDLVGFDSPMLARAYSFRTGAADKPPLLSSSATFQDNRFFVLNMRPGWLRIDVFSRSGLLENVLVERSPAFQKNFYPTDIDVTKRDDRYLIAVSYKEPEGQVKLYEWRRP